MIFGFSPDRTLEHVKRFKQLQSIGFTNLTTNQKSEFYSCGAKASYDYQNVLRVEHAVSQLAEMFGLTLTVKTDWTYLDTPTKSDMERYLGNVVAIRNHCATIADISDFPTLPESMDNLDYEGANNIEKTLNMAYVVAKNAASELGSFILNESALGGFV